MSSENQETRDATLTRGCGRGKNTIPTLSWRLIQLKVWKNNGIAKNWRKLLGVLRFKWGRGTGVPRRDNPSLLAPKHTGNYTENGGRRRKDQRHGFVDNVESILVPFRKPGVRVAILGSPRASGKLIHKFPSQPLPSTPYSLLPTPLLSSPPGL